MKVIIQSLVPSPYRMLFFNELGKLCDLTVVFEGYRPNNGRLYNWNENLELNFKAIYLSQIFSNKLQPSIIKYFYSNEYDIKLISAYHTVTGMYLISMLKLLRKEYLLEIDGAMINLNESKLKKRIKSFFLSNANGYLSPSNSTDSYFKYYGKSPNNLIYRYPFTSIQEKSILKEQISIFEKSKLKNELNIPFKTVILSVGQFIYRKGFDILLKSCKDLKNDIGIILIGGKPTKEYIDICKEFNIKNIIFYEFMNDDLLSKYYKASDIFVLPTREDIWGLVINEAMAYGLPVITTDKCVAGTELISSNYIIPIDNIDVLSSKINFFLDNIEQRLIEGEHNLNRIKEYTIENMALTHYNIFQNYIYANTL